MGKLAILGDQHFGASGSNVLVHQYMRKFYADFFDYVDTNNIKTVLQLGDMFDVRKHINTWTLSFFREVFLKPVIERDMHVIVLLGNHDIFYRESLQISSVEEVLTPYQEWFTIVKESADYMIEDQSFLIVPWVCKENLDRVNTAIAESKSEYCAGHFEFNGFELFRGQPAKTNYSHEGYSKFEKVFSGHYHHMSSKDNVLYTGTPYELTWQDCGTTKGFFVLDDGSLELVETKHTLFSYITLSDYADHRIPEELVREKHVKLKIDVALDPKQKDALSDMLYSMQPHSLKFIEKKIDASDTEDVHYEQTTSIADLIKDYVTNINVDAAIDKDVLIDKLIGVYIEATHAN